MIQQPPAPPLEQCLTSAGLAASDVRSFAAAAAAAAAASATAAAAAASAASATAAAAAQPGDSSLRSDRPALEPQAATLQAFCRQGRALLDRLPLRSRRSSVERAAGEAIVRELTDSTRRFFRAWRVQIYDSLTAARSRPLRVSELAARGAELLPGILPNQAELSVEAERLQKDKDGLELQQGLFFSALLGEPSIGLHLCGTMLRPTRQALDLLPEFERTGKVQLGTVCVEAQGEVGYLYFNHPRYLNAEDDETLPDQELACDLILLHPHLKMGVLRGGRIEHPRYRGRRIFSAGLNLTRLYHGKLSYLFYITRDMGLVNKLYRGLLLDDEALTADRLAMDPEPTVEKPWLAIVEGFAIGGGCQLLLVMDYVIAESGAYCNLPARKEGIIPGCANLRLPRMMGERLARQAIMFDRTFYVDSAEAAALVNEVQPRDRLDGTVRQCVDNALSSGMVSAGGNRKALRIGAEPLDTFRAYMATYASEQAFCHLSEQLIHNLERHWRAAERRP